MTRQLKFSAAALSLIIGFFGIAACSNEEGEPSVLSEARASVPFQQPDYGWRTQESATAAQDGTVYEYQ
jgi:hypothetical protein